MKFLIWLFSLSLFATIEEKVIICGIAKDVAPAVAATIASIETLGSHFLDYRVVIYENNSSDTTPQLFAEWANRNPRVLFLSEVLEQRDFFTPDQERKLSRTEILAKARNTVLHAALQSQYDGYRYVIMVDMDFCEEWDIAGILSSFENPDAWDAIFANGIYYSGLYWDFYAFRDIHYPFGPELYGPFWWQELHSFRKELKKSLKTTLFPVFSAFGGLGIYKRESIRNCFYSGTITHDLEILMQNIMQTNDPRSHLAILNYRTHLQRFPTDILPDGKLQWFRDTYLYRDALTVCEHIPFHASMILQGHDKLFINPKMIMRYYKCIH